MSAEGMPQEESLIARPLAWMTARILAAPRATLGAGLALAAIALVTAALGLGFRTSRLDLLDPESGWNQRWLAYLDEFGREDDAVIVVEGDDPAAVTEAVDDLAAELTRDTRYFSSIFHRLEMGRIRAKGLHLLSPADLAQLERFVAQAEPVLRGDWQQLAVENQLARLTFILENMPADSPDRDEMHEQLERLARSLRSVLADEHYVSPWPSADEMQHAYEQLRDQHLTADDGRLGLILVKLSPDGDVSADHHAAIVRMRELMELVEARHPEVTIGATGMPVLEHDEMHTSQRDMTWTGALSMIGVGACFWAALGGWRHAAMAMVALSISMAWAFGFVTLAVGHLNLLSVSFASVLIGQGIDFGIHYVAGYLRLRSSGMECGAALCEASRTVGPGIFTGGLTTASAFCMMLLTGFVGLQELGIIAGGGILICTIGSLILLPPLLLWTDGQRTVQQMPTIVPMRFLTWPMHVMPKLTIAAVLAATVLCGLGLTRLRYDHNLLHLQPRGLASVELEHTLIERADRSVWFALSMSPTRDELLERKAKFEQLTTVAHTEEIASLLPEDDPVKETSLDRVRQVLALAPDEVPQLAAADSRRVQMLLHKASSLARDEAASSLLASLAARIQQRAAGEASARLSNFQQQAAVELVQRLRTLRGFADPAPPRRDDLPRPIVDRFIGSSGQYLLKVYAAGDVWDIDNLERFVRDIEQVDPRITGHPVQTYYASRQMQQSYLHAGIYAFLAMVMAVMIDLRRVRLSLLAVLPMLLGLVQMFGLLGWLGVPLNAANMIVLPLIFGIGIDDGVHVTHDFLHTRGRYRLDNATFVAVLLTSVTTMVGFGSLVLAQHQGLRSLGQVLTLGVLCCLVSSTTFLPAMFVLWTRRRADEDQPAARLETQERETRLDESQLAADRLVATRTRERIVPRRVAG